MDINFVIYPLVRKLTNNIMKKEFSKEELQENANKVFEQFPNAKKVYATLDGNTFLDENRARLHAGKGMVVPFEKPVPTPAEQTTKPKTAPELIEEINLLENVEALEDLALNENRKTVLEAISKRKALLESQPKDNAGNQPE